MKQQRLLVVLVLALIVYQILQLGLSLHPVALALFGYAFIGLIIFYGGYSLEQLGLSKKQISSAWPWYVGVFFIIITSLALVFLIAPDQFADERYNFSLFQALLKSLVFLPVQTVLFEELVFRGFLYAYFVARSGIKRATVYSSLLFGLWHIGTASGVSVGVLDSLGLGNLTRIFTSIGVVLVTTIAGYIFTELRTRSGSLLTPIIAHWAINGTAIVLAALSFRLAI